MSIDGHRPPLLGHEDISTTEIYLHVAVGANGLGVMSPLDGWAEEKQKVEMRREEDRGRGRLIDD